jgi:hypothetical protein
MTETYLAQVVLGRSSGSGSLSSSCCCSRGSSGGSERAAKFLTMPYQSLGTGAHHARRQSTKRHTHSADLHLSNIISQTITSMPPLTTTHHPSINPNCVNLKFYPRFVANWQKNKEEATGRPGGGGRTRRAEDSKARETMVSTSLYLK